MSVISHSYANVVSSFYSTKFQRNIEELLVAPVPNWVILAGYVSGGIIRGLLVGLVVALISLLFADIVVNNVLITLSIVILTATVFLWLALSMRCLRKALTTFQLFLTLY